MTILHGDTKIYNNIFVQEPVRPALKKGMDNNIATKNDWDDGNILAGTFVYEKYPTFDEWNKQFEGYCGQGTVTTDKYYSELPVWAGGNVYLNGARPMSKAKEPDAVVIENGEKVTFTVEEKADGFEFKTNLYDVITSSGATLSCRLLHTDDIMMAFEPEQKYENPDGSPITFDEDLLGIKRDVSGVIPGPFVEFMGEKLLSFPGLTRESLFLLQLLDIAFKCCNLFLAFGQAVAFFLDKVGRSVLGKVAVEFVFAHAGVTLFIFERLLEAGQKLFLVDIFVYKNKYFKAGSNCTN
jgi:hypothetical protein